MRTLDNEKAIDVLAKLASGWRIEQVDHGGHDGWDYYLQPPGRERINRQEFDLLDKAGFLHHLANMSIVSEVGRVAYIRSTDELQNGKVIYDIPIQEKPGELP